MSEKHPEKIRRKAVSMLRSGIPLQPTAEGLKISREAVRRWFNDEPDVKLAKAEATQMRKAGKPCREISDYINENYDLNTTIQTVGAWTNKYVKSRREIRETYWERKAKVNWDLLRSWKVTYILPKYYRFRPYE